MFLETQAKTFINIYKREQSHVYWKKFKMRFREYIAKQC